MHVHRHFCCGCSDVIETSNQKKYLISYVYQLNIQPKLNDRVSPDPDSFVLTYSAK